MGSCHSKSVVAQRKREQPTQEHQQQEQDLSQQSHVVEALPASSSSSQEHQQPEEKLPVECSSLPPSSSQCSKRKRVRRSVSQPPSTDDEMIIRPYVPVLPVLITHNNRDQQQDGDKYAWPVRVVATTTTTTVRNDRSMTHSRTLREPYLDAKEQHSPGAPPPPPTRRSFTTIINPLDVDFNRFNECHVDDFNGTDTESGRPPPSLASTNAYPGEEQRTQPSSPPSELSYLRFSTRSVIPGPYLDSTSGFSDTSDVNFSHDSMIYDAALMMASERYC